MESVGKMDPSLALLITGQVRAGQLDFCQMTRSAAPETQIIASVWNKIGMRVGGWLGPWQIARVLGEVIGHSLPLQLVGFGNLEHFLPDYFDALRSIDSTKYFNGKALHQVSSYVDVEDQQLFVERLPFYIKPHCTVRFIHHKFARALALMEICERERGYKFKDVMRVRPDLDKIPETNFEFSDDEIFVDGHDFTEDSVNFAGDNAILARREVMIALCEFFRFSIYEELQCDVHEIIHAFISKNGLRRRGWQVRIADDQWPRDLFIAALEQKAQGKVDDFIAREFLACIRAHTCLQRGDLVGAALELDALDSAESPAVMLCRGQLALAERRMADVDAEIARLRRYKIVRALPDLHYLHRLETLRADFLKWYPDAGCIGAKVSDHVTRKEAAALPQTVSSFSWIQTPKDHFGRFSLSPAHARQLRQLISILEVKLKEFEGAFDAWMEISKDEIYGVVMQSGNYRCYRLAYIYLNCTVHNFREEISKFNAVNEIRVAEPETFEIDVTDSDFLPGLAPNFENLLNVDGSSPDSDRQTQHCVWYEQHSRTGAAMRQYIDRLQTGLSALEREASVTAA